MRLLLLILLHYSFFIPIINGVFVQKHKNRFKAAEIGNKKDRNNNIYDDENDDELYDPSNRLSLYLRNHAKPYRRPVVNPNERLDVYVKASLYQIVDIDQRNNLATISGYFDVWWYDPYLKWNISDFDNISKTFVPIKNIWKPEFHLYHSIQGRTPDYDQYATAQVENNGRIRMFVPITSRALCPINVKYFPFDTQNCSFMVS